MAMNHVVRTSSPRKTGEPTLWHAIFDDGSPSDPVDLDTLKRWASEGTLTATTKISTDKHTWMQASHLPELEMDWLVLVSPEAVMGPFVFAALEVLRASGHIPQEAQVFRRQTAPTAGSQGMQLVQRALAAETHRREAESESQRLRTNLEAKDLEFEAERQQFAAEASRLRADLLRKDSEIASLKSESVQISASMQDRQELEARLVDAERDAARMSEDIEGLQRTAETLRSERDLAVEQARQAQSVHAEKAEEALRTLEVVQEVTEQRNHRLAAIARELQTLAAEPLPEAAPSFSPEISEVRPAPSAERIPEDSPQERTAGKAAPASAEVRRIAPHQTSKSNVVIPEVVMDTDPAENRAAPVSSQTPPPVRAASTVNSKKLAELEAQAQQELARLKSGKGDAPFWNRRKQHGNPLNT